MHWPDHIPSFDDFCLDEFHVKWLKVSEFFPGLYVLVSWLLVSFSISDNEPWVDVQDSKVVESSSCFQTIVLEFCIIMASLAEVI